MMEVDSASVQLSGPAVLEGDQLGVPPSLSEVTSRARTVSQLLSPVQKLNT
jgi:hypothetical protein